MTNIPPANLRKGMALVLVLSCLALLSILVVAFISSISTEVESSSSYSNSSDVKQRSQTAVNMVIAQIQDATSSSTIAWSSQPGLIRTFDNAGGPDKSYKLYSSGTMVAGPAFNPGATAEIPPDWQDRPAEYTDLNQPTLVPDAAGPITKDGASYSPSFPILDPGALGTVKGFSIVDGQGQTLTTPPNFAMTDPTLSNPAAMPVQWLYMLKDGSLRAMNPGTKKIQGATKENPVVSRIAFWTDDDTCKVNINTAAGDEWAASTQPGSFMDMPRSRNSFEGVLKNTQPVVHEYQRYPGHPATTYLSAVFPNLTREEIGNIVPRVKFGGSRGGTVSTYSGNTANSSLALPLSDGLPLYASVDELRYVRSTTPLTPGNPRLNQDTLFTPKQVETSQFFLTANSRAPEVNLFNQPRISMWPEPAAASARTAFDKAIAFCSTIAGQAFYFVRSDPTSPTADYTGQQRNQDLYNYLKDLTEKDIPGFGASFLDKYPSPGSGRPPERDQILTEIFDYIRSSINLVDGSSGATVYAGPKVTNMKLHMTGGPGQVIPIRIGDTMGFGRTCTLFEPILHIISTQTDVDPLALAKYDKWDGTQANAVPDGVLKGVGGKNRPEYANQARLFTKKIQVALLFNTFSVAHGPARFVPDLYFEVSGLNSLKVAGKSVEFGGGSGSDTLSTSYGAHTPNHEYAWGSFSTFANLFWKRGGGAKTWGVDPKTQYPFISKSIDLGSDGVEAKSPLSLVSGPMVLNIYAATSSGEKGDLVQTINFKFPATEFPAPYRPNNFKNTYNTTGPYYNDDPTVRSDSTTDDKYIPASPDALSWMNTGYFDSSYDNNSIIRSVTRGLGALGVKGDMRLVAAMRNVPESVFTPLPGYDKTSTKLSSPPSNPAPGAGNPPPPQYNYGFKYQVSKEVPHNPQSDGMVAGAERMGNLGGNQTLSGNLLAGVTYDRHINAANTNYGPAVSWGVTEATLKDKEGNDAPGDWDTGMGSLPDGPFINKADEGEIGNAAYSSHEYTGSNATLYSPNRQVPSPVILGSLSTGVIGQKPWQTLLFCPNPPAKSFHPGTVSPPDHLFLDFFNMPVVEPYAISEPFSTAGKINLNYQIVPFTNIQRNTGLQALLRSVRVGAVPTADGLKYKSGTAPNTEPYRIPVDIDETLKGFDQKFANNEVFRSASQICEQFLVPSGKGATIDNISTWWDNYKLTSDNLREHPYALLYSRVTTKSNTYTVHVRVQTLKKPINSKPDEWNDKTDKVLGEYRGSFGIERYLDPNLTTYTMGTPLTAYKFRTLNTKQFTP